MISITSNQEIFVVVLLAMICIGTISGKPTFENQMVRVANGCGAQDGLNIDWALRAVGEGVAIRCCNKHDICYETCGRTQSACDSEFLSCLNTECSTLGGWFEWWSSTRQGLCKLDGHVLFGIVNFFGSAAFTAGQQSSGCRG